jgi:hypothetical protein
MEEAVEGLKAVSLEIYFSTVSSVLCVICVVWFVMYTSLYIESFHFKYTSIHVTVVSFTLMTPTWHAASPPFLSEQLTRKLLLGHLQGAHFYVSYLDPFPSPQLSQLLFYLSLSLSFLCVTGTACQCQITEAGGQPQVIYNCIKGLQFRPLVVNVTKIVKSFCALISSFLYIYGGCLAWSQGTTRKDWKSRTRNKSFLIPILLNKVRRGMLRRTSLTIWCMFTCLVPWRKHWGGDEW